MPIDPIIEKALENGQDALSEHDSKALLEKYSVPVAPGILVETAEDAARAAGELGYPVVLKACGSEITHKTERDLVAVGVRDEAELREAFDRIIVNLGNDHYEGVVVYRLVPGERELVIGLIRDPQFGPCVMFGLGGIFTEILKDTSFRVAPITEADAFQMMEDIRAKDILGPVRGKAPADKEKLARALVGLGKLGLEQDYVAEVDVNPLIIKPDGTPVAVDALVVLARPGD
ncbi:MAG: acetate--CoA ligase family protein [Actinobacteria bacterium]|nr:acetate--CoA ligase family protein [Actinomycetota bacterium]MBU4386275.1 acetate--CoA ligase family protein [Actinomycetota bacterium]